MIFSDINILPLTENKENYWKNKVSQRLRSNNSIAGDGINVDYTPHGAVISQTGLNDNWPLMFVGDYDFNAEYFPNQIVRVNPTLKYANQLGQSIPFGNTSQYSSSIIPINPGLFICNAYVPPGTANETWLDTFIVPQYPQGVPFNIIQGTRYYEANVYYPIYPEIPTQFTQSFKVPTDNQSTIVANQVFWVAMPFGSVSMKSCLNNAKVDGFILGYISGSSFDQRYLPLQPS